MQLNPYLNFDGHCESAFRFYAVCLGGKIDYMETYGNSPMAGQIPAESHSRIMHASLSVNGQLLQGADSFDQYSKPKGFCVMIHLTDAAEADRVFKALSEDGSVQMPLQETFWALRFCMFVDKFGIPWMINCAKPMPA